LSPLAYVTSRKRFSSLIAYIRSIVCVIIRCVAAPLSPLARSMSSGWIGFLFTVPVR